MNAIGASIFSVIAVLLLFGNRRIALVGMMAAVLYLPQQQAFDFAGANMTGIRLLELVALLRIFARRELFVIAWNRIDALFLIAYGFTMSTYLLRSDTGQFEMIGSAIDATLCYFTFRSLLRNQDDLEWFLRSLVVLIIPFLVLLTIELNTGKNPFAALGTWASWVELRDDRPRAMGSFRNPSLLGTLGASFVPLYIALLVAGGKKRLATLGLLACGFVIAASNSGGPISAAAVGILGWLCWPLRAHMHILRRALLITFCALALAMDAPVWSLIERVSFLSGGSGWHRAHLLTMAYRDIDMWWLIGMPVAQTRDWFPYVLGLTGTADITNTFVDFGLKAGVGAILLFVYLLVLAYRRIGQALDASAFSKPMGGARFMLWGLGCTLAVHVATWFSITYFDQIAVVWFLQLAMISTLSHHILAHASRAEDSTGILPSLGTSTTSSRTPYSTSSS
jgi:hypothetical protein